MSKVFLLHMGYDLFTLHETQEEAEAHYFSTVLEDVQEHEGYDEKRIQNILNWDFEAEKTRMWDKYEEELEIVELDLPDGCYSKEEIQNLTKEFLAEHNSKCAPTTT